MSMDITRYLDYNHFFCCACEVGNERIVQFLLTSVRNKINVNCQNGLPLIMACRNGYMNLVILLVEKYCAIASELALTHACKHGHIEIATRMISRYSVSPDACEGWALIEACDNGYAHVVEMLLEAGADPRSKDQLGLNKACSNGYMEILDIFLKIGNISFSDAFVWACWNGRLSIMKRLWTMRNDDCRKCYLQDVYEKMCEKGEYAAVESFLTLLSDQIRMDYNGGFIKACCNGHFSIVKMLINQESAVDVNVSNGLPLIKACMHGRTEIVKLLLDNDARVMSELKVDDIKHADIKELILKSNALHSPPAKKQRVVVNNWNPC